MSHSMEKLLSTVNVPSQQIHCGGTWDLNHACFRPEISGWGSAPSSLHIPVPGTNEKFLPCRGSNPGLLHARQ